jgi:hypothetical protein
MIQAGAAFRASIKNLSREGKEMPRGCRGWGGGLAFRIVRHAEDLHLDGALARAVQLR